MLKLRQVRHNYNELLLCQICQELLKYCDTWPQPALISKMQAVILVLLTTNKYIRCEQHAMDTFEKSLPQFRMKMEEVFADEVNNSVPKNDSNDDFVSFLVNNIKTIFVSTDNSSMISTQENKNVGFAPLLNIARKPKVTGITTNPPANASFINDTLRLVFLKNNVVYFKPNISKGSVTELSTELLVLNHKERITKNPEGDYSSHLKKSCIFCDNVISRDCSDPRHKLVQSIDCQREDDQCYSQHTPFGIIDRGCFNVNHDLTLFVCACNLCNYISISEMPYIFSNKRDWVENVIELSRAKRIGEPKFKDLSCLRCEVNVTATSGNIKVADTNCLEGNSANLPSQRCASDEICAVKSIRSEGYIWRGCVSEPLYNYWWTLCEGDWCNNDVIVSVYDIL